MTMLHVLKPNGVAESEKVGPKQSSENSCKKNTLSIGTSKLIFVQLNNKETHTNYCEKLGLHALQMDIT